VIEFYLSQGCLDRINTKKGKEMIPLQKKLMNMITIGISFVVIIFFSSVLAWGETSMLGGEIPMINGATVVKERFEQGSGRLELEVNAAPEEVANFYQKVMEQKGWPSGKVMSIGNQSILMLNNKDDKFILKAKLENGRTQVTIALIQKAQSKTIPKNSGMTIEGAPPAKSSFVKRIVVPAKKDSKYQPNDPAPQPDDPSSNSDEPSNSNDKDIKSDDDSEKISEMLSVSLFGSVKWDIDEEIKKAWNYKGSVTYQYTGNMKLIQKADRETSPVLIYRPEGMTLSYNFNETFTDYVDECPVQFEHNGGGGSQIDESAELKIIRIGAMAAPYMKNLSADKQQFLTSMQGSIAIPDYYEFHASGPSDGGKMQGRTRFTGACDSYEPTKRSLAGLGGMVQMKIPKSGSMEGSRSWSADYQGTYPPSLNFFISDVASSLGKSPLSPPEGGKENVTYNVSWRVGGAAKLQNTDSEAEEKEEDNEDCKRMKRRVDFLKCVKAAYENHEIRNAANNMGGSDRLKRAMYYQAIRKVIEDANGNVIKAETATAADVEDVLWETYTKWDPDKLPVSEWYPGISTLMQTEPIKGFSGHMEGIKITTTDGNNFPFILEYYDKDGKLRSSQDAADIQKNWEVKYGEKAGRSFFKNALEHERVHVEQYAKDKFLKSVDDMGDREIEGHQKEIDGIQKDIDEDC